MSGGLEKMANNVIACLNDEEVSLRTWICGLFSIFGVSLAYAILVFVILLAIKEAKRVKKQLEKNHPGAAAAEADPDLRQQYFDMHYEKINQTYYINENTFDNAMQQESFYSNLQTVTESVASKDTIQTTSNNAELILRELFVPIQEEVAEVKVAVATKSFAKPRHWSVKDFPRRSRRSTSDLQQQASKRRLHSSLKQRSSLQSMRTLSSSSVSASVIHPDPHQRSRRPAIVFNNQLSYSDETYSTMV